MKRQLTLFKWSGIGLFAVLTPFVTPFCCNLSADTHSDSSAVGHWEGSLTLPGTALKILLDFELSGSDLTGSIDIPAQGLRGFHVVDIETTGNGLSFALPDIPGEPRFEGEFSSDGDSISGHLSQSGQVFPFSVYRTAKQPLRGETPSQGIPGEGLAGAWQGSLRPGAFEMRLLFKIESSGDTFTGTLSSLDQNAYDIPVSRIRLREKSLTIEIDSASARFEGNLSADGSEVVGTWLQGNNVFPLTLKRLENEPDLSRPQDPVKPYPYSEEAVIIKNTADDVLLSGTITIPAGEGPHPAVVLISGSGPQDRDQALMGHRPFLVIADRLAKAGIAALRYDDRGYAKSTGNFKTATTEDFTRDALTAFDHLRNHPGIDAQRIGLMGHSEGGLIAPRAAVAKPEIAFIVLLAGVGVPMDELLVRQSQDMIRMAGGSAEMLEVQTRLQGRIFQAVRETPEDSDLKAVIRSIIQETLAALPDDQRELLGFNPGQIEQQVELTTRPWFRHILTIDPGVSLRKVHCPVLAVNGDKDIQVASQENLEAIQSALKAGGNETVTIIEFPGLNHLFQTCETGATHEYATIEETFNEDALRAITKWIQNTVDLKPASSQ